MILTGKQKNYLRGLAHSLSPIVTIGNKGLTAPVLAEIEAALDNHELLKIKLPSYDKSDKVALIASITASTNAEPVQLIGRVGVIYRAASTPKLVLPSI
jgi:RNA-binding protein